MIILGVIDLTVTHINNGKYYYGSRISKKYGLKYDKIQVQGHGNLPHRWQLDRFNNILDQYNNYVKGQTFKRTFPEYNHPDATPPTVLVHCTHGVNRTGYFIANYLMEEHKFSADKAINLVQKMRGHDIKYGDYREDLKDKEIEYMKHRIMMSIPHNVALPISSDSDDSLEIEDSHDSDLDNSDEEMGSDDAKSVKSAKSARSNKSFRSVRSSLSRTSGRNTPGVDELNDDPKYQSANVIFVSSDSSVSSSDSRR